MKNRVYEFVTGIETSVQPDSGTPSDPNDVVTKSYVDSAVSAATGTEEQESFAGPGSAFVLAHTPTSPKAVKLYVNGSFQTQGVHYTISGPNITMTPAIAADQTLDAVYTY